MNETLTTIHQRRSVRKFKQVPPNKDIIEDLLNAGRSAPSAINKQPWRFYVITNTALITSMAKEIEAVAEGQFQLSHGVHLSRTEDAVFHGAPVVVFISAPKDNEWAELDVGMCAQNMMLAAKSLGLDSCPVGFGRFVEKTKCYSLLNVPASERIVVSLVFGYGDEQPKEHPRRRDNVVYVL